MTVLESQDRRGVDWYGMAVNTLRTEPPGFKSFRDYLLHSTEIVTGDCTQPRGAYLSPPLESKVCRGCILPALLSAFIGTWRVWKWRARGGSHVLNQMRTHAHSGFDILINHQGHQDLSPWNILMMGFPVGVDSFREQQTKCPDWIQGERRGRKMGKT